MLRTLRSLRMRSILTSVACFTLIISLHAPRAASQQAGVSAPIPTQITSAKRVFVSNAQGEELDPQYFFMPDMSPDAPYAKFYNALKNTGRYELVGSPADADLILEIRFRLQVVSFVAVGHLTGGGADDPFLRLSILDPKSRVLLWAVSERVKTPAGPHWKEKRQAEFDRAISALAINLGKLAASSSTEGAH